MILLVFCCLCSYLSLPTLWVWDSCVPCTQATNLLQYFMFSLSKKQRLANVQLKSNGEIKSHIFSNSFTVTKPKTWIHLYRWTVFFTDHSVYVHYFMHFRQSEFENDPKEKYSKQEMTCRNWQTFCFTINPEFFWHILNSCFNRVPHQQCISDKTGWIDAHSPEANYNCYSVQAIASFNCPLTKGRI